MRHNGKWQHRPHEFKLAFHALSFDVVKVLFLQSIRRSTHKMKMYLRNRDKVSSVKLGLLALNKDKQMVVAAFLFYAETQEI